MDIINSSIKTIATLSQRGLKFRELKTGYQMTCMTTGTTLVHTIKEITVLRGGKVVRFDMSDRTALKRAKDHALEFSAR